MEGGNQKTKVRFNYGALNYIDNQNYIIKFIML